ncbi:methylenetetrahydrofolate reductase [NAD(P)H] [Salibaculum sp.]|uniref:methylenetetrahydrofolate reductase [NAD(P)H] n=1 Tax=Salibaculum sp. TaxID=2855480 RepID=UPI002B459497|nr:methylenetetrahydrofolate reductase [NAD(P)H] [Salibaculum sp.]HKL68455.1 methylenetetrahydrofolate reductase [NAD(P)H] [Salibaculum sp.]
MTRPALSFEFFPPKSLPQSFRLWDCVTALAPLAPDFVSVTYGAGGTTRKLTHEAVQAIGAQTGLDVAAHLTCVEATKDETLAIAEQYRNAGVNRIVALRGDPPKGAGRFVARPDGFSGSVDLVEALAGQGFDVSVGAYPEKHPDATDHSADIEHLKRKLDAGADTAITQFFFEAETFFRFRDACEKAGIDAPIIPGILPVENWSGTRRFAEACGTAIPQVVSDAFETAERDGGADLLATALATELCDDLLSGGVEHLHFYTLNKPDLTRDVCHALGITPQVSLQNVA